MAYPSYLSQEEIDELIIPPDQIDWNTTWFEDWFGKSSYVAPDVRTEPIQYVPRHKRQRLW